MLALHTPITLPPSPPRLGYGQQVLSFGSCFSEHIGAYLRDGGLQIEVNPYGIQYNPLSIAAGIERLLWGEPFDGKEVFEHGGLYHSFLHHGSFSSVTEAAILEKMNGVYEALRPRLPHLRYLFVTYGTAYVYRLATEAYGGVVGQVVSNCHKLPESCFTRERMSPEALLAVWTPLVERLRHDYPDLVIVQTVSPVRHLRDGAHGNALSKASLLLFAEALCERFPTTCFYFPSYELLLDELRDYRFYAEDMVHPSPLAQRLVAERFASWMLDDEAQTGLPKAHRLHRELRHRPLHAEGQAHRERMEALRRRIDLFRSEYPLAQLHDLPLWID